MPEAIKIVPHFGTVSNVTVDGNVLLGGGYTIYAMNAQYTADHITISNNDIGLGIWGQLYPGTRPENFFYVSNHNFSTGTLLPRIGMASTGIAPSPIPKTAPTR